VFARTPPYHQVLWPDHCRQNSSGAELHPALLPLPPGAQLVRKGTNPEVDSYSAFFDNTGVPGAGGTGLQEMLVGSTELVVVGVATDYCVGSSALHGLQLGLPTSLLADLARPVAAESGAAMEARVAAAGGWVEGEAAWRAGRGSWAQATRLADFWLKSAAPGLKASGLGALAMALLATLRGDI
jgi:nicotinamidase-related amidase